jgi:C-terminal processing protease CtpA/Prc
LWLTYSRYLTPKGAAIQGRTEPGGIVPTVAVDEPDVDFGAAAPTTDPILDKALERAKIKVAA